MAVILITHDLGVVAETCDRVIVMYAGMVVEEGPVERIFADPRHPYTQGLLQAIPRLDRPLDRLAVIPGAVPSPTEWPVGCRFHTRCPYGWDLCVKELPELFDAGPQHASRCWLEKHPERRAEVDRTRGGFAGALSTAEAPAEAYHREAAARGAAPPAEGRPPEAPAQPLETDPDTRDTVDG